MKKPGRLIILAGPSCVGKSPLAKSIAKFHPELFKTLQPLVLYLSRAPRPIEVDGVDYHFRTREQVEALRKDDRFAVLEVRGDLQALDLEELSTMLQQGNVFFEGNPFIGRILLTLPQLADIDKLSVFMSPLNKEELNFLQSSGKNIVLPDLVTDIMRRKLLRRTRRQKSELSLKDLENIEVRSASAYAELKEAHRYDFVIPNHDGEDSENWDAFYFPLGDARKALETFVALLKGEQPHGVEQWEVDLLP